MAQQHKGRRADQRRSPILPNNVDVRRRNFMNASPMAWISGALSILSLGGMVYSAIFAYAGLHADMKTTQADVARNTKEHERRSDQLQKAIDKNHEFSVKAVERIDTTMSHLSHVNVKIGVLETKLEAISDILKRMERQMDKQRTGMMGNGKHK